MRQGPLGDNALTAEVERDLAHYGDERKFDGGKVLRDECGQRAVAYCSLKRSSLITRD